MGVHANKASGITQEHGCTLPSDVKYIYICGSQCLQVFQAHPCTFCPSSQLVFHIDLFTCVPPPRGPVLCWKQRCPGVSRQRWGSALPGHDTTPKHTSFSSPSPVETGRRAEVRPSETVWRRLFYTSVKIVLWTTTTWPFFFFGQGWACAVQLALQTERSIFI